MKKLLLRALNWFIAVLFPGILFAQQNPDYAILLHAGKFTPSENARTVTANSDIFRNSLFGDKHYLTLQFKTLPDQREKVRLQAAGIELIDYLPNLAYTAAVQKNVGPAQLKAFPLRSIFQLSPAQKTVPALLNRNFPAHAIKTPGFVDVTIIAYEKLPAGTVAKELEKVQATILEDMPMYRSFTVRVAQQNIEKLVKLPFIQWVEPVDAPNVPENLLGRSLHRVNVLNDGVRNLKGDGINIGIWDGGEVSPHLDFSPTARLNLMETSQDDSHSTHVAGTIGGRGLINPKARGMAPNAKLYSYDFSGSVLTEMYSAIPAQNLAVSSHSYGSTQTCGITGAGVAYSSTSRSTDINLNTFPSHLHVHSAGNSQSACSGGWSTITGSGKTAKNNILVANITSSEAMNNTSSFGPVADGRVKPEISAFGTNVLSTYTPLNSYGTITGTSMSTPGVSGSVALLVERYKQLNANASPISSLIKGVVCNTAADLGNPGPDYKFGFGRINALAAVKALEQNRYAINTVSTGTSNDVSITVPSGTTLLKVMLTWNDPAGTVNAAPALVNNLDLSVIGSTSTTLPWILNPNSPASNATRATDNISNIEQVTLDNPAAGTYTLRVNGALVPTGANQQYALTWEVVQPGIEIIFPNGGESLDPGKQETITWDNAGITGNQTVQYSINNGATWTTISSTVPASTTRLVWTVPTGLNTSTALVKVSSGSLSDQSDATFRILGTPLTLNATSGSCAGSLNFDWPAVTNATHYDLYQLDMTTGEWTILGSNIAGTTYAATGLTPNASLWFTLVAKNNLVGSVSEKALAINKIIPAGSLLALGSISGLTSLCSSLQNVTYSVSPASGVSAYNWTVPTGASIVSGQGTTTITVDFGPGGATGNISVQGLTGVCQTASSTLAVSATNNVTPPVSGGDQTVCSMPPSTMLTATATVPPNHSLAWYNTPTGGNPLSTPELRNPGTVTYYAASINMNGGCESIVRTPVTLTINEAPQPSITSNGSTSICEGNTVTLNASSGTGYLWSNGDTTQSITAGQPGDYTVTVWQANGCSSTSSAMHVNVSPKPTFSLVAEPNTEVQPGQTTTLSARGGLDAGTTFIWKKNGTIIPGESKAFLQVSVPAAGEYTVEAITGEKGCSLTSNAVTLTDAASNGIFIYPNPNQGRFQVRYYTEPDKTETNKITVYDARGALVHLQPNTVKQAYDRMDVDMSQHGNGVYWLLLQDANGKKIGSGRFVID